MKKILNQLVLGVCLAVLLAGANVFAKDAVILEGVSIGGVDVSGMTAAEAEKALDARIEGAGAESLLLGIGEHTQEAALSELGLTCDYEEIISEALQIGRKGNVLKRYKDQKNLQNSGKDYPLAWRVDGEKVRSFVEENCTQYDQEAVNASLTREGGEFQFQAGKQGLVLDVSASAALIADYVENEWQPGEAQKTLELKVTTEEPEGSMEQLAYVTDLLGSFTSSFATSNANRCKNLSTGAAFIDGTVLYPGEEFSTYEVVSPFTVENGYALASAYQNGEVIDSVGGGICQVSSTLYNAVLRAELEVTERWPHSLIIHYMKLSEDAAIAGTYKDFKFVNSSDYPIYIEGYTTSDKKITFNIYGKETRPANREVSFESVTLTETPSPVVLVENAGLPLGYKSVSGGWSGYTAELYKIVKVDGVQTERTRVNKSSYSPTNRVVTYGTAGDPVLAENLRAAIAAQDEALADANIAPYAAAQ